MERWFAKPTFEDYECLIRPIEQQMMNTVWRITQNADDAEDALQHALEKVWRQSHKIRRHPNPHACILRICIHSALDLLRRRAKQVERLQTGLPLDRLASGQQNALQQAVEQEIRIEIGRAIAKLPRKQAEAVIMRLIEEMPYADIARALDCNEATVRTHVKRARRKLQEQLSHLATVAGGSI